MKGELHLLFFPFVLQEKLKLERKRWSGKQAAPKEVRRKKKKKKHVERPPTCTKAIITALR